jgi:hypothetical protein
MAVYIILLSIAAGIVCCSGSFSDISKHSTAVDRPPSMRPDYCGVTIPPNIGPLNFVITEPGSAFFVRIFSSRGDPIDIFTKKPRVIIPQKKWSALLMKNNGQPLHVDIFVQNNKAWSRYKPVEVSIASEKTDPYLLYRTLSVLYNFSRDLCIYQRNLETNRESEVLNARNFFPGCCNCHTLQNNDPSRAMFHVRTQDLGNSALVVENGAVTKLNTKLGYTSWHPSGKLAVCSVNKINQCFHAAWRDIRDAFDLTSGLVVYDAVHRSVVTVPQIYKEEELETWPCWSPDGNYLYFSSARILWKDFAAVPPPGLEKLRYNLMRVSYDERKNQWGDPDTVLSSAATGLSITQPRVSPDGKFVLFCMHRYGPSPYLQHSSDLYLMNLSTKAYFPLAANSGFAESWHTWSSNSRWIAFTSKRDGGILARIYLCRIDSAGASSKPFIMPQADPEFYDSFIKVYNVPEFSKARFTVPERRLVDAIRSSKKVDVKMPVTGATPQRTKVKAE